MASVTGFTAARMLAMEAATIVDGDIVGDNLILTKHDGTTVNAGNVRGPTGSPGITNAEMLQHLPAGVIMDWIGTVAPTKYLGMTGQQVVGGRTLYPDLWSVLPASMKHANGDDIVFPDSRGRVSVGYNAGDSDFNAIGKIGGEKTHILTIAEMPAHDHGVAGFPAYNRFLQGLGNVTVGSGAAVSVATTTGQTFGQIQVQGGDGAHNNLQPFIAFMKIIKAA